MGLIRFLLVSFIFALASFTGPGAASAQALPPSLEGETFQVSDHPLMPSGQIHVNAACPESAGGIGELTATMTLAYVAHGFALGPYPGFFIESGTVTASLTSNFGFVFAGIVTEWKANFTIDSPVGQVTGEKTLIPTETFPNTAQCRKRAVVEREEATAHLAYRATITTPTGTFTDEGRSLAVVWEECFIPCTVPEIQAFGEHFYLSTGVLPTSGTATGGGQIVSASDPRERITFGFNVRKSEDGSRLDGHCNVIDRATGTHVKCLTVTDYEQIANSATWKGTAAVNGVEEEYRITVQDNGEPNQGIDTFSVVTESYRAGGNVEHGNVQIHKRN